VRGFTVTVRGEIYEPLQLTENVLPLGLGRRYDDDVAKNTLSFCPNTTTTTTTTTMTAPSPRLPSLPRPSPPRPFPAPPRSQLQNAASCVRDSHERVLQLVHVSNQQACGALVNLLTLSRNCCKCF
jgi:hypothetical protein